MWTQVMLFVAAVILIPLLDYVWLGQIMSGFYLKELGSLARMQDGQFKPQLLAAFFVYVFFALAMVCFVLSWVESWPQALVWGSFLGFLIYGIFDLTNLSIIQGYSLGLSLIDMVWGTILGGTVCVVLFFVRQTLVP